MATLEPVTVRMESRQATCACGMEYTQLNMGGAWMPDACTGCVGYRLRVQEEGERAQRHRDVLLQRLDVPPLYRAATLENFELHGPDADKRKQARVRQLALRYLAAWPDHADAEALDFPQVVIFRGSPGTGKGHVAWAIARTLASVHGVAVLFCKLPDAIRDLRGAWGNRDGENEAQRLARYRNAGLLIVDEVSQHSLYGQPMQHLYDMVDWRQEHLLPTILTTNESPEDLTALIGPALESRAAGWSGTWDFGEHDYRVHRRQQRRAEVAG